jgi:hypothetical protein
MTYNRMHNIKIQFPLPILIPPTAQHSSSTTRDWYNGPTNGRRTKWTQFRPTPLKNTTVSLKKTEGAGISRINTFNEDELMSFFQNVEM